MEGAWAPPTLQCRRLPATASLSTPHACLPPSLPHPKTAGEVSTCKVYQIQQGDTLLLIASVFGVYGQVRRWN